MALGAIGAAFAQDAPAPGGGGGGGGRGALAAACGADIQANCAGQAGRGIRQCLTENQSKVSDACKAALAAAPRDAALAAVRPRRPVSRERPPQQAGTGQPPALGGATIEETIKPEAAGLCPAALAFAVYRTKSGH